MSPDYLFIAAGALATAAAAAVLIQGYARRQRRLLLTAALWSSLAAGCFLQGFAPNLRIERNTFVLESTTDPTKPVEPRALVERERLMKTLSALFLVVAAAGLFVQYRELLLGPPKPPVQDAASGEPAL